MTAATSHSEVSIPLKDKRIRVQDCNGGYAMMPHNLLKEKRSLTRSQANVFEVVWEYTVSYNDFRWPISMERLIEETGLSERSIQSASKWLKENGWLTIELRRSNSNIYGIPEELLEKHGCLKSSEKQLNEENCTPPSLKGFKERKKKEIPKPTLMVATTGPSKEVAVVEGLGSFVVEKAEELPIVKEIIEFGVNKQRVLQSLLDKKEKWVTEVYEEFLDNFYNGKHEIKKPAAVLWKRLGDYEETWRKGAVETFSAGKTPDHQKLPEGLVEKYQQAVDEISPDENDLMIKYLSYVNGLKGELNIEHGIRLDFGIVRTYLIEPMAVNMVKKALDGR